MSNELYKEVRKKHIDWEKVESLIKELGPAINDMNSEGNLLADLYQGMPPGEAILKLTQLFLDNGFDVNANDDLNGAYCLRQLCWSTYDRYILDTAELLLDVGANCTISTRDDEDDDEVGVLGDIAWKLGYWNMGCYESANLFETYYYMIERAQAGKAYKGIRSIRDCVGKKLLKVEKLILKGQQPEDTTVPNSFRGALLLWCEENPLFIRFQVEAMINPYFHEEAQESYDISSDYSGIIGNTITGIRYTGVNSLQISFDNGMRMKVMNDYAMGAGDQFKAYVMITSDSKPILIPGTTFERIYLNYGISYGESTRKYEEESVYLINAACAYRVYGIESEQNDKPRIRIEEIPLKACRHLRRTIENIPFKFIDAEYVNDALKYMKFISGDICLYLTLPDFGGVRLIMLDKEDGFNWINGIPVSQKINFIMKKEMNKNLDTHNRR